MAEITRILAANIRRQESRVASVGVRRVKSALARSKSSDKFVIGFKQPLFVN